MLLSGSGAVRSGRVLALVVLHIGVPGGVGGSANVAFVRFFASVRAYVPFQSALLAELLVAVLAVERPLVRVHSLVHFELVLLVASVAAGTAHEPVQEL